MIRDERWKWERAGWGRGRQQMNRKIWDCKERGVAVSVSSEVERQWVVSSAVIRHLHFGIHFNSSTHKRHTLHVAVARLYVHTTYWLSKVRHDVAALWTLLHTSAPSHSYVQKDE